MKRLALLILLTSCLVGCPATQFSPIPFQWADLNQDGYIVFDEYYYFMTTSMEATPPFDLQAQFYAADDNHDGIVTPGEHWSALFPANTVYRARSTY